MQEQDTIITERKGSVAILTLNRPEMHNAMDIHQIRKLTEQFRLLEKESGTRIVILTSSGKHFSAGADLKWMKEGLHQSPDQLKSESLELAGLFRTVWESDLVIISSVRGKVLGGANGLVAASDIVIAEETATFAFTEVRLGLVPATIAPFILAKVGASRTAELMLSGRAFPAKDALNYGLVHQCCEEGKLNEFTHKFVNTLLSNGPGAMKKTKMLLKRVSSTPSTDELGAFTSNVIAMQRISPEGQEGMNAFFEKRNPDWYETL